MRKPKHREVRGCRDEHHHVFSAHAPSAATVRVRVSEAEYGEQAGKIYIDLEDVEGDVMVRWSEGTTLVSQPLPSRVK